MKRPERFRLYHLPAPVARVLKRAAAYPRYWRRAYACQLGYKQNSRAYPQNVLFIAGLPKSGTTWLEKMLCSYPGFHELLIPEATSYEMATGGSHDYELPEDIFGRLQNMLIVMKMHIQGSAHNVRVLKHARLNYVILYRDLRDVAVSYFFYVRQTPWHPEYHIYQGLTVEEGLLTFARRTLPAYIQWVHSWEANRDPARSLVIHYESMLTDTVHVMQQVARHFSLDSRSETVRPIVEQHTFQRLSNGRQRGHNDAASFFRKGVVGDWQNYFTTELKQVFKEQLGNYLTQFGYEADGNW